MATCFSLIMPAFCHALITYHKLLIHKVLLSFFSLNMTNNLSRSAMIACGLVGKPSIQSKDDHANVHSKIKKKKNNK